MHKAQRPDFPIDEANKLIAKWLPDLGFHANEASNVLERIATKTGILVNEGQNTVVFAQFGLQEYFASLEALEQFSLDQFAKFHPKNWWREVILLTIAQQHEPTMALNELFNQDPLLAAAAVAECPTPNISLQKRAIDACLEGIDSGDKAVANAIVPLLRKLRYEIEDNFCEKLESRLKGSTQKSLLVGLALATAGTEKATNILAKHPEVWDACLKDAGYLSASFENLLVGWIEKGDDTQSEHAADLLSARLSADRFRQLLDVLPTLKGKRAGHLATLLLRNFDSRDVNPRRHLTDGLFSLWALSRCVPFIQDREDYISKKWQANPPKYFFHWRDFVDLVTISLFLEKKGKRLGQRSIYIFLRSCNSWTKSQGMWCMWFAASISFLAAEYEGEFKHSLLLAMLILIIFGVTYPYKSPIWTRKYYLPPCHDLFTTIPLILVGCLGIYSLGVRFLEYNPLYTTRISICLLGLICVIVGWHIRRHLEEMIYAYEEEFEANIKIRGENLFGNIIKILAILCVLSEILYLFIFPKPILLNFTHFTKILFSTGIALGIIYFLYSLIIVQRAKKKAMIFISKFLK